METEFMSQPLEFVAIFLAALAIALGIFPWLNWRGERFHITKRGLIKLSIILGVIACAFYVISLLMAAV
jgi:hypothetical protein